MGVVYHATYLRWFEAGRAHCMRARDCSYSRIERDGEELVRGFTRHAAVGRAGHIARLPEEVRAALLAPERNPGG
jgi:acyl-CoA thioesterase FadM